MAIIRIIRPEGRPTLQQPEAILNYSLDAANAIVEALKALVLLDRPVREARSLNSERGGTFVGAVVTNAAITRIADLVPSVINDVYTTLLLRTDAGSGAFRWRIDGGNPQAAALATAGMPGAAAGDTLNIVGQLNIREFAMIAEAGNVNASFLLFK